MRFSEGSEDALLEKFVYKTDGSLRLDLRRESEIGSNRETYAALVFRQTNPIPDRIETS